MIESRVLGISYSMSGRCHGYEDNKRAGSLPPLRLRMAKVQEATHNDLTGLYHEVTEGRVEPAVLEKRLKSMEILLAKHPKGLAELSEELSER
jgi:hypothetical protein